MSEQNKPLSDPKEPVYSPGEAKPDSIVLAAAGVSGVAVVITIAIMIDAAHYNRVSALYAAIGAWTVGPPSWFWYEYFFVYRRYGRPGTQESFKNGQDAAKAIWAAVLAGLLAFASSDAVKAPRHTHSDATAHHRAH